MKTYYRIAKKDCRIENSGPNGGTFRFKAGDKVLTSERRPDGVITVLSNFWVPLPLEEYFNGETPAYGHGGGIFGLGP